jgi:hypothetical protein
MDEFRLHYDCIRCLRRRSECTCTPKAEFDLNDETARRVHHSIMSRIEDLCRETATLGWGYRLAVRDCREKSPKEPTVFSIEYCILMPGQEPPLGKAWVLYSPWKVEVDPAS